MVHPRYKILTAVSEYHYFIASPIADAMHRKVFTTTCTYYNLYNQMSSQICKVTYLEYSVYLVFEYMLYSVEVAVQ